MGREMPLTVEVREVRNITCTERVRLCREEDEENGKHKESRSEEAHR